MGSVLEVLEITYGGTIYELLLAVPVRKDWVDKPFL